MKFQNYQKRIIVYILKNEMLQKKESIKSLSKRFFLSETVIYRIMKGILPSYDSLCHIVDKLDIPFIINKDINLEYENLFNNFFMAIIEGDTGKVNNYYKQIIINKKSILVSLSVFRFYLAVLRHQLYFKKTLNIDYFNILDQHIDKLSYNDIKLYYDIYAIKAIFIKEENASQYFIDALSIYGDDRINGLIYYHMAYYYYRSENYIYAYLANEKAKVIFKKYHFNTREQYVKLLHQVILDDGNNDNMFEKVAEEVFDYAKEIDEKFLYYSVFESRIVNSIRKGNTVKAFELVKAIPINDANFFTYRLFMNMIYLCYLFKDYHLLYELENNYSKYSDINNELMKFIHLVIDGDYKSAVQEIFFDNREIIFDNNKIILNIERKIMKMVSEDVKHMLNL